MIRQEDVDLIKSQVNMVMIAEYLGFIVDRSGHALCPFHQDKRPSMKVYSGYMDHDGYYCWVCGKAGDIISFVREYCNLQFDEAIRFISMAFGIQISDNDKLSDTELREIKKKKHLMAIEKERKSIELKVLRALSEKIRFYEKLKNNTVPFSDLNCMIINKLVVMQARWEEIFDTVRKKGAKH